jgi:hypothetical protein
MRLEDAMIEYIQMSNRQCGRLVKKVRCDNGSEYQSTKLLQYYGANGILLDASNPYQPERKSGTNEPYFG